MTLFNTTGWEDNNWTNQHNDMNSWNQPEQTWESKPHIEHSLDNVIAMKSLNLEGNSDEKRENRELDALYDWGSHHEVQHTSLKKAVVR